MGRLQELVRLHRMGTTAREQCRLLRLSSRTRGKYFAALDAAGLLAGDVLPSEEVLQAAVVGAHPIPGPREANSSVDRYRGDVEKAVRAGVGPTALYDLLRRTVPEFSGSLSAVKRLHRSVQRARGPREEDIVIPVVTGPGQVAQVDFGYVGMLQDDATGATRKAYVFVMVLSYSRHMYCEVVFDQCSRTWQRLHRNALAFFGGSPHSVVPDNLKSAVLQASFDTRDRDNLTLNRSYRALAVHYGFKIDPTPAYSPQKKGKVEAGVKYVQSNYFAAARPKTLSAANQGLLDWCTKTAGARRHGTTGQSPLALFEEERAHLLPLPPAPFRTTVFTSAKVRRDVHVAFERCFYSVPWQLVGRDVLLKAVEEDVYVYCDNTRVATHRVPVNSPWSTDPNHLPPNRQSLRERDPKHWLALAVQHSPELGQFAQRVWDSDSALSKLSDLQLLMRLASEYPASRIRTAVVRANYFGLVSAHRLRKMLSAGLDLEPLPTAVVRRFGVLEAPRFARAPHEKAPTDSEVPYGYH